MKDLIDGMSEDELASVITLLREMYREDNSISKQRAFIRMMQAVSARLYKD